MEPYEMDCYKDYKKIKAKHDNKEFIIMGEIPKIGAYLFIYENGICTYDYLQDTIEICKEQAFKDWGVPMDSWEEFKV